MSQVRVGLIGCGAIARRMHVPALQRAGAVLTAFASRSRASAEAARDEAQSGEVVDDWRSLVTRDDVDAVVICTPNALHAPQALAALDAGKHVLVEKPFTITVEEADAVLAAAASRDLVVMAAQSTRFYPQVVAARDALRRGEIGMVTAVRAVLCNAGPLAWAPDATWFLDPALSGGGALLDLGVHLVDTIRTLLDDDFSSVAATLAPGASGLEEDGLVLFDTRKGVVGSLHAGWRAPVGRDFSLTVVGDAGMLSVTVEGAFVVSRSGDARGLELPKAETVQDAFVRAVVAGSAESPDGYDGRTAVAVVQAAYESAREGRTVQLP
ncbi:MAG: Gfo/Idh/MocA family oxidoreductase [Actinomycetota bacterium]|nr:Gfo/Idh/MocA family oxidoreductase [Actinomycetota bacterium]